MFRPHTHNQTNATGFIPARRCARYLLVRQEDLWFIKFDGEEFGPYKSEREALLFAIDAAHKVGEQGEEAQVLVINEDGTAQPAWTYGQDPFPPNL